MQEKTTKEKLSARLHNVMDSFRVKTEGVDKMSDYHVYDDGEGRQVFIRAIRGSSEFIQNAIGRELFDRQVKSLETKGESDLV